MDSTAPRPTTVKSNRELVFLKTLSFFAATTNARCGLACETFDTDVDYDFEGDAPLVLGTEDSLNTQSSCTGRLVLVFSQSNLPQLQ